MSRAAHKASVVRREELIDAALELIGAAGLSGLNIQTLARRVGLVPSAIYRHFDNKQALLDAIVDAIFVRIQAMVDAAEEDGGPWLACLERVFHAHLAMIGARPGIPLLIFSHDILAGQPGRPARILAGIQAYLDRVATLLVRARDAGEVANDLDCAAAALSYLGLLQPVALLRILSGGSWDLEAHAATAWPRYRAALRLEGIGP